MKRIQFCCGGNKLEGFDNFDAEVDITKPLPFANDTYDFAFIEHGCEHISAPDCLRFFDECHRIMRRFGRIRVCVPILERILSPQWRRDLVLGHGHQVVMTKEVLTQLLDLAGFTKIEEVERDTICDSHWKVIGRQMDDTETLRMEAEKA